MSTLPQKRSHFRLFPFLFVLMLGLASALAACSASPGASAPTTVPSPTLGVPASSSTLGSPASDATLPPGVPVPLRESDVHPSAVVQPPVVQDAAPTSMASGETVTAPTYEWVTLILLEHGGVVQVEITPKEESGIKIVTRDIRDVRQPKEMDSYTIGKGEARQIDDFIRLNEDGSVTYTSAEGIWHFYARVFGEYGYTAGPETWVVTPNDTTQDMAVTFSFDGRDYMEITVSVNGQTVETQRHQLCPKDCELRFDLAPLQAALPVGDAGKQFYAQGLHNFYQFSFPAGWRPAKQ